MKFKTSSWLAVSLLLGSQYLGPEEVNAFKFPADLDTTEKKIFIEKVGKLEKKFQTGNLIRKSVKSIKKHSDSLQAPIHPTHGPLVQTHKDNTFQR